MIFLCIKNEKRMIKVPMQKGSSSTSTPKILMLIKILIGIMALFIKAKTPLSTSVEPLFHKK